MSKKNKEMSLVPHGPALSLRDVRDEQRMLSLLRRRGLLGYDPNSEIGKYINELIQEIAGSSQTGLPDPFVMLLAEQLAFSILGGRSMAETMIAMQAPPDGSDLPSEARRKAWTLASTSWQKFHKASIDIIKILGIKDHKDQPKTLQDILDELSIAVTPAPSVQDAQVEEEGAVQPSDSSESR